MPHGDSEFFFVPHSWQDEKHLSLLDLIKLFNNAILYFAILTRQANQVDTIAKAIGFKQAHLHALHVLREDQSNKFKIFWRVAQNSISLLLSYFVAQYVLIIVV